MNALPTSRELPRVALLMPPRSRALIGFEVNGKPVEEWTAMALARRGIRRLLITSTDHMEMAALTRLRRVGITIDMVDGELRSLAARDPLLIVSGDVFVGRSAIAALSARVSILNLHAAAAAEATPGMFALLTPPAVAAVRGLDATALAASFDAMRVCHIGTQFCRVATAPSEAEDLISELTRSLCADRLRGAARRVFRLPTGVGDSDMQI